MARAFAAVITVLALVGCAQARELPGVKVPGGVAARRHLASEQPASAYGWYNALAVTGMANSQTFCGLRDFPPIPDGYGTARIQCGGDTAKYDHYWMWRIERVDGGDITNVTVNDPIYLTINEPMLPYCGASRGNGQVKCGYELSKATKFSVEQGDPTIPPQFPFDVTSKPFYIKVGAKYCTIKGKKNSAYLYCDQAIGTQTFNFPYNGLFSVKITSQSVGVPCSSNFIPLEDGVRSKVNCTTEKPVIPSNYPHELFLGLKDTVFGGLAGKPQLQSGNQYAFKYYDTLYKYQLGVWGVEAGANHPMSQLDNKSDDPSQWITVEKLGGAPRENLRSGDKVTLKSALYNKYCGVSASSQIVCDRDSVTASDAAYLYTFEFKLTP